MRILREKLRRIVMNPFIGRNNILEINQSHVLFVWVRRTWFVSHNLMAIVVNCYLPLIKLAWHCELAFCFWHFASGILSFSSHRFKLVFTALQAGTATGEGCSYFSHVQN